MRCIGKLLLAVCMLMVAAAHAPSRADDDALSFIVPYAAGGTADTLARKLAEVVRQQTGLILVIENQGGAGGTIGAAQVARSKPDGRTVMLASTSALTIGPNLGRGDYDPIRDFTPLLSAGIGPVAILATKSARFKDLEGALEYARAHPGAIRYGTPGVGSVAHLAMEGLQMQADVALTHVPYRGESPAIQDGLGGVVELLVVNTPTVLQHAKAGTLRPLAVLEPERLGAWPDVPTLQEAGYEDLNYNSNFGVFTAAGLSKNDYERVSTLMGNAVESADFQDLLRSLSLLPGSARGQAYARQIADEHARNAGIIKARRITAQ